MIVGTLGHTCINMETTNLAVSFRRSNLSFFTVSTSSSELEVLSRTEQNAAGDKAAAFVDLSLLLPLKALSRG
jgi:hypothetical protein